MPAYNRSDAVLCAKLEGAGFLRSLVKSGACPVLWIGDWVINSGEPRQVSCFGE